MSDDFSADTSTTGAVAVNGGFVTGNIETSGDHDWFAVTLVAGRRYTFRISGRRTGGGTLSDPILPSQSPSVSDGVAINDFTASSSGVFYLDASSAGSGTGTYSVSVVTANATNDLNANGHSDILWRNSAGSITDWNVDAASILSGGDLTSNGVVVHPDSSWTVAAIGDLNGDGHADLLWRNSNGMLADWMMDGNAITASSELLLNGTPIRPDASWTVVGTGTLGYGKNLIFWRNADGRLAEWFMDGSTILASAEVNLLGTPIRPDASWKIAGLGDFNGDASTDLLWRGPDGELIDWSIANATSLISLFPVKPAPGSIKIPAELSLNGASLRPDATWTVAGVGDFDANGTADILWRGTSGSLSIWSMNGSVISSAADPVFQGALVRPDATWHVVQVGDFNGDSYSDILWRSDSGALAEWLMNGSTIISSATLTSSGVPVSPDATWTTQARPTNFA